MQAYHVEPYAGKRDPEYAAYADECINRNAGYAPTWSVHPRIPRQTITDAASWEAALLRAGCQRMTHYVDPDSDTLLGQCDIADAKRQEDDAAGGLVFLALNRQ